MMESIAQQAAKDARDVFSDDRQAQAAIGYMEQLIYAALRNVEYVLFDPVTVHANMLRGTIAKPTVEQIIHLYGVDALAKALAPVIVREAALDDLARLGQEFDAAPNLKRIGTGIYEAQPAVNAPAEDAKAKGETDGQMLERLGMDGAKWAAEFRTTALRLGYSDMDEGWLIGWFANAIMAGYDRKPAPDAHVNETPKTEHDAGNVLTAAQDDPECTCCGGTGVTYQTERRCACQGPDLSDPVTVHANMLRGTIAKPTLEQIIHLYGVDALTKALASIEYERKVAQMREDFPNGI